MAHLKTKATTGKLPEREQWKWRLIRGLYENGFFVTWYGSIGGINRLNPYLAIDLID